MKTLEFVQNLVKTTKVPDDIRDRCFRHLSKNKKFKDASPKSQEKLIDRRVKSERKKTITQLKFFKEVLLYMETNPREEFLTKQLEELTARETKINENFDQWIKSAGSAEHKDKTTKELKSIYQKEMNLKKIQAQARFISFILK